MEFVSITQASDSVAKQFLQAFDNDVQAAVEAYFEDPEKYNSSAEAPNDAHSSDDYVEEDEDYVRAPMKPVRKRLIGEDLPAGRGRGWRQGNQSEAFRDLREEQSAVYGGTHLQWKLYELLFVPTGRHQRTEKGKLCAERSSKKTFIFLPYFQHTFLTFGDTLRLHLILSLTNFKTFSIFTSKL